jgi:N-acetylneuraminate synthase
MLGSDKSIKKYETKIREWAYRSVVSMRDLAVGEIIGASDICTKRPGVGIPSKNYEMIIGKKVINKIIQNSIVNIEDLE